MTTFTADELRTEAGFLRHGLGNTGLAAAMLAFAAELVGQLATVTQERDALKADLVNARTMARLGIEGDNHHNAARCPYCIPTLEADGAKLTALRAQLAEARASQSDWCAKWQQERIWRETSVGQLTAQLAERERLLKESIRTFERLEDLADAQFIAHDIARQAECSRLITETRLAMADTIEAHLRAALTPAVHASERPETPKEPPGDEVCKHGVAMDVHCCNCHRGFIFDPNHKCPNKGKPS